MTILRNIKTNFTAGEIASELLGRGDLRAYDNGAAKLTNIGIHPTGGISRRRGTYFIDQAYGQGRLIGFEFNAEQTYLLVVTNGKISIYRQGLKVTEVDTPWTTAQIPNLTWTQNADTVLLCHPDVPPKKLLRRADNYWTLHDWSFAVADDADVLYQPYFKFTDGLITALPSGTTGTITLSVSSPVFTEDHVGTRLRIKNKEVLITGFSSSTVVTCLVKQTLVDTQATIDWAEQAFSTIRGYPQCAVFHQDRLVIGGSRDLPNRLWFSKSGDLWNFDKGTGLDDESIEFGLYSDQVNTIKALFSGRHLQVFTSGAEWIVTGTPLTPTNIQLNRQTRIGTVMSRYIPPVDVDGATIFVGRTGRDLREFLYADVEQAYQANDLALIARHVLKDAVDQCFDPLQRILFCPLADGKMAALTIYRTESVFAWSRMETDGHILSVATVGPHVYALIRRHDNKHYIERFDEEVLLDSALSGFSQNPTAHWSGLNHLSGRVVRIIADGIVQGEKTVVNNELILDTPARHLIVGLPYTHIIEPLPPNAMNTDGGGRTMRLIKLILRMQDTQSLRVDTGRGLKDIALRQFGDDTDTPPPNISGDVTIRSFGWSRDNTKPLWRIEQELPLPCTILSATMEMKVND